MDMQKYPRLKTKNVLPKGGKTKRINMWLA